MNTPFCSWSALTTVFLRTTTAPYRVILRSVLTTVMLRSALARLAVFRRVTGVRRKQSGLVERVPTLACTSGIRVVDDETLLADGVSKIDRGPTQVWC